MRQDKKTNKIQESKNVKVVYKRNWIIEHYDSRSVFQLSIQVNKNFAVVLKIDPLTVVVKNNTGSEDQRVGTKTRTLCFIGTDGTLSAYEGI